MALKMRQCKSCNGVYLPVQADASAYYHACAPVGMNPDGTSKERPNKRDENIQIDSLGRDVGIIANGAGAVDL